MQTQNILAIRKDTSSCDAQKPKFIRDAVMSEYSDVFGEELGRMEEKVHLETDSNVAPLVMPPRLVPVLGNIPRYGFCFHRFAGQLMSYCKRAQVSCRLLYLQIPRLIHKVQKLHLP